MKLFDETNNYELRDFSLRNDANKQPIVYINIFKDTSVSEGISEDGKSIISIGKDYNKTYHSKITLFMKSLGVFNIHSVSEADKERINLLARLLCDYKHANVFIEVFLTGDMVPTEVALHGFKLSATATVNQWGCLFTEQ